MKVDPNDMWAEVELWKHQYGHLPQPEDKRPLIIREAGKKAAEAVRMGKVRTFNAASMIEYLAKKVSLLEDQLKGSSSDTSHHNL